MTEKYAKTMIYLTTRIITNKIRKQFNFAYFYTHLLNIEPSGALFCRVKAKHIVFNTKFFLISVTTILFSEIHLRFNEKRGWRIYIR